MEKHEIYDLMQIVVNDLLNRIDDDVLTDELFEDFTKDKESFINAIKTATTVLADELVLAIEYGVHSETDSN